MRLLFVFLLAACDCDDRENLPACEPGGELANRLYCDACGTVWICAANQYEAAWYYSEFECECITDEGFVDTGIPGCAVIAE